MKKVNQLKAGMLLSYGQMAATILINLLYTPILIRMLGQSEYGLYNTAASTISMLSVLNLGFNTGYIKFYSIYKRDGNQPAIARLNGLFLIISAVIAGIAFACGIYLTRHLTMVFDQGLTPKEYEIARVMMILLTINLSSSLLLGMFYSIVSAHERFIILKSFGVIKTVLGPLLILPLLFLGYRSIAMVTITVAVSMLTDLLYAVYAGKVLHEHFAFHDFEKGLFRKLFVYTAFIAINLVVDQINLNIDKVLLGRYQGTAQVAVYSVSYTLYTCYVMFSTSVSGVFVPKIHGIVAAHEIDTPELKDQLTALFTKVGRIQFLILGLAVSGFVVFGKPFIQNVWAGQEYGDSYYIALCLMIPGTIPLIQNLGIEIQRAQNRHKFRSIAYLVMALVNLVLTIYLCRVYGAIGAAGGTAVSFLLANGLMMNIYYHKRCNLDIKFFWRSIGKLSRGLILPLAFGTVLMVYADLSSLGRMVLWAIPYIGCYCVSMWLFGMNSQEKELVRRPISNALRKLQR